ncbi:MAG TPA: GDP-mannose 4,6-dehydratase [Fibrobacteria bacterium]|nr:GDP-mannose 4,6-dehydratase [Fibrobacteria bacterium]
MSVLVSGGTCCLGYHLLSLLSHGKDHLISYSGDDPDASTTLQHVTYITGDLLDFKNLLQVLGDTRPAEIYHMVSQGFNLGAGPMRPNSILQFLILGTQNLFEAVRLTVPKARVILVSSSEIYGAGRGVVDVIHRETDPPIPFTPYATAIASCELLAKQYLCAHNLDIVTVRPFSSTGPFQERKFVLPSVAAQIATIEMYDGETVIYTGNLDVSRDYLDVRDQARAIAMLAKRGEAGEVYNVCSGKARTIRDLVHYLIGISGYPIETRIDPSLERAIDIPLLVGSPEKIMSLTGWKPIISIEDSLKDLYSEIKIRLQAKRSP